MFKGSCGAHTKSFFESFGMSGLTKWLSQFSSAVQASEDEADSDDGPPALVLEEEAEAPTRSVDRVEELFNPEPSPPTTPRRRASTASASVWTAPRPSPPSTSKAARAGGPVKRKLAFSPAAPSRSIPAAPTARHAPASLPKQPLDFSSLPRGSWGCLVPKAFSSFIVGEQLETMQIGSFFSGLLSEKAGLQAYGVDACVCFSVDSKESSWNFIESHYDVDHHFLDARELLDVNCTLSGVCAKHGFQKCSCVGYKGKLDTIVAGTSCKPFSLARTGRREGADLHADSDLDMYFLHAMKLLQPAVGVMENVFGYAMPERKGCPTSPLDRLRDAAKTLLPEYHLTVVILDGKNQGGGFVHAHRRRIFVIFFHASVGGKGCEQDMHFLVEAGVCFQPPFHYHAFFIEKQFEI